MGKRRAVNGGYRDLKTLGHLGFVAFTEKFS
jgi:hypothetical protein